MSCFKQEIFFFLGSSSVVVLKKKRKTKCFFLCDDDSPDESSARLFPMVRFKDQAKCGSRGLLRMNWHSWLHLEFEIWKTSSKLQYIQNEIDAN